MPYIERSVPQALNVLDPGVKDVYSSPNVFINNVPVALWKEAVTGNSALSALSMPAAAPVDDYAPNQSQKDNYNANQNNAMLNPYQSESVAGADAGKTVSTTGGDAIPTGTGDPNDAIGNPQNLGSPVALAPGDTIWGRLENYLNACLTEAASGAWKQQTPAGAVAPNYQANPNIMNAFAQVGFPKNVLDNSYPGPAENAPGDRVYWCAAFAGLVLKASGANYLNSLSSFSYTQSWNCTRMNVNDPGTWRRNDVVWFDFGHMSFIRYIDNGYAYCTGGNQSDAVTTSKFSLSNISFVGRAWEVPKDYDKPLL